MRKKSSADLKRRNAGAHSLRNTSTGAFVSSATAPKTPLQGIFQKHPSSFRLHYNTLINNYLSAELSSRHLSAHASALPWREAKIVWRMKHFFSQPNEKSISAEWKINLSRMKNRSPEIDSRPPCWRRTERQLKQLSVHNSLDTKALRRGLKDEGCFWKIPWRKHVPDVHGAIIKRAPLTGDALHIPCKRA